MRWFLLFIGWSSVVGSFADGALGLYALWVVVQSSGNEVLMSLDAFIKQHVAFIYWVKQLAYYVMPNGFVTWVFSLPALVYFPIRLLTSVVIGWWALKKAAELSTER
ncbi:hypothetical protein [Pseudoalteromonas sp. MMG022]|uniref:hypothetical protein n=1 Tax=Pseudoalteromonas sp. MMG022 TaxID=2909978 RepID=UPI001F4278F8|nr:hypothetical protein [Pseudoalteromonas sp. MMG022]MCF6437602.1 hypothetical protein [Pseudoalteromonas sp. MMG022]